jgi:hypothetical protein
MIALTACALGNPRFTLPAADLRNLANSRHQSTRWNEFRAVADAAGGVRASRQLRRLAAPDEPVRDLAAAFGIGRATAYRYLSQSASNRTT